MSKSGAGQKVVPRKKQETKKVGSILKFMLDIFFNIFAMKLPLTKP